MQGYEITSLSSKTQKLIADQNLDINQDGLINEENGELAELLSKTGKSDINDLCYDSWLGAKAEDLFVGGIFLGAAAHTAHSSYLLRPMIDINNLKNSARNLFTKLNGAKPEVVSLDVQREIVSHDPNALKQLEELDKKMGTNLVQKLIEDEKDLQAKFDLSREEELARRIKHNNMVKEWKPKVSMKECLQKALKIQKRGLLFKTPASIVLALSSLFGVSIAAYLLASKPQNGIAKWTGSNEYTPVIRERSEYEDQYRQAFGEEQNLNEYTPQKGEYWTAILKAKYGVDDATALRMAHSIKEAIYGDPTVAKQSPVMYLPQSWDFEGNVYQYNDSAQVKATTEFSDDVKTENGKLDKDLQY